MALAGVLEIADREFQAIQDEDTDLRRQARSRVSKGQLAGVEITPDALHAFLDKRLGQDKRISGWSYDWTARLLKKLGFRTLDQVERAVRDYDDDLLSQLVWGSRQGQITRFELMLRAAMGDNYLKRHLWSASDWFIEARKRELEQFEEAGVAIGSFDPLSPEETKGAAGESEEGQEHR